MGAGPLQNDAQVKTCAVLAYSSGLWELPVGTEWAIILGEWPDLKPSIILRDQV